MQCRHLTESTKAFRYNEDGTEGEPITVMLCAWADHEPGKLLDTPRWLQRNALAGYQVEPRGDCVGCPCFSAPDL